jgi:phage major head subunit gpT-like protein
MPKQQFEKITTKGVQGMFYRELEAGNNGWATRIGLRVQSDSDSETYGMLGMVPQLAKWTANRDTKELAEYSFSIANDEHQAAIVVRDTDMRRDKTGQLRIRMGQMADRTNSYPAKLISSLMMTGASALCYDNQYFFDTDHESGDSGVQSNKITAAAAAPTAPTVAEMQAAILAAVKQMYSFKDDQGEPMNEGAREFMVMTPVSMWDKAVAATAAPLVGGGDSNIIMAQDAFSIVPVANPRLTWTDTLAVLRTDGRVKPFIIQEEMAPDVWHLDESSTFFHENGRRHKIGVDWSGNVGFGEWAHAAQVTFQ